MVLMPRFAGAFFSAGTGVIVEAVFLEGIMRAGELSAFRRRMTAGYRADRSDAIAATAQ